MSRTLLPALALALAACSAPEIVKPYRMEIQQGNYVSQEMVSQLRPGMTKDQVRFILGTPLVTDIFHADRWDYVYYREVQGSGKEQRRIAVLFEDGKLARVVGDVVPAAPRPEKPAAEQPKQEKKPDEGAAEEKPERGFFGRMLDRIRGREQ